MKVKFWASHASSQAAGVISLLPNVPVVSMALKRMNGSEMLDAINQGVIPYDGTVTWIKRRKISGGYVCGKARSDKLYDYEVEYRAGPKDKEWFCQVDCNYLFRLLREGNLQKEEPDVWALRELGRAEGERVDDIKAWWRTKVFLPNIDRLLETAEHEYSVVVGKLLAAELTRHLPLGNKSFESGLLNIIRGYLGLQVIKPNAEQLLRLPLAASIAFPSERGLFSPRYYERKDQKTAEVAEKQKRESTIVTNRDKSPCVIA